MKGVETNRLKDMLRDTITLLCKNGLTYKESFSIEALIGITLDDNHVFLVNINESVQTDLYPSGQDDNDPLSDCNLSDSSTLENEVLHTIDKITPDCKRKIEKCGKNLKCSTPKKKIRLSKSYLKQEHALSVRHEHNARNGGDDSSEEDLLFVKAEAGPSTHDKNNQNSNDSGQAYTNHIEPSTEVLPWTIPLPVKGLKQHSSSRSLMVSKNLWSKSFSSPNFKTVPMSTESELVIHRPTKRVFSCHIPECQQQFFTKRNLTGHLWKKHQIGEPTICQCGQVFAYKNKFYVHRKSCPDAQVSIAKDSVNTSKIGVAANGNDSKADEGSFAVDINIAGSAYELGDEEQAMFRICDSRSLNDSVKEDSESQFMHLETL